VDALQSRVQTVRIHACATALCGHGTDRSGSRPGLLVIARQRRSNRGVRTLSISSFRAEHSPVIPREAKRSRGIQATERLICNVRGRQRMRQLEFTEEQEWVVRIVESPHPSI
jgi:2-iminoacetate synthase ThiH